MFSFDSSWRVRVYTFLEKLKMTTFVCVIWSTSVWRYWEAWKNHWILTVNIMQREMLSLKPNSFSFEWSIFKLRLNIPINFYFIISNLSRIGKFSSWNESKRATQRNFWYLLNYFLFSFRISDDVWNRYPIAKTSWSILQDFYHDPNVLVLDPSLISLSCIQLSLQSYGIAIPYSEANQKPWHLVSISFSIFFNFFLIIGKNDDYWIT